MAPYDEEFTRLKAGDETRKMARGLYLQASELTKPGSGRGLGLGHNALSAVCAFLASKRLGNGEVTRDQACAVACVDPKTFDSALAVVESVLRPSRSSPRLNQTNITYRSLSKQFVAREDAYVPMAEVEEKLKGCEVFVDGSPIDLESSIIQCAIFYWVCTAVLRVTVPDATYFRQMLKVSPNAWSASQRTLEKHCSHMMDDLIRKAETALSARTTRSQMRTATKEKVQPSLTNMIATPRKSSIPLTPPKSPLIHSMKRELSEAECKENGSPSKRAKRPTYIPSGLGQDFSTHTPKARRINAAASLPTPPKSAILHKEAGDPLVGLVAFDKTPTTSTSMSDTSSASPAHLRAVDRTRLDAPLVAKGLSYTIQEEIPRRRRRNLRAAFLNPGVYGWNPAAHTAKKLERARNWESLMIDKYGDPWGAW